MIIYMHLVTYEMLVYIGYKSIMANSLSFRSILDADKLIEPNFIDLFWNIKIILKQEKKAYVLDDLILEECHNGFPLRLRKTTENQMELPPIFSVRVWSVTRDTCF